MHREPDESMLMYMHVSIQAYERKPRQRQPKSSTPVTIILLKRNIRIYLKIIMLLVVTWVAFWSVDHLPKPLPSS